MTTEKQQLKTVLITGGGTGIGYATAKFLLETKEYRVILLGRIRQALEEAAESLGGTADTVNISLCDLKNPQEIKKTAEKIVSTYKTLYGLVNNAGIYPFGGITTTTEDSWDETLNINLKAPFLLSQGLMPALTKSPDGARIVNVSSTAGLLPNHFALAYSVSKAALIQFTRTLAKEVGEHNITVNCICPGIVRSPLHDAYHHNKTEVETFYAKRGAAFPLGRVGEPEDIAGAVRYFLSREAAWVTGDVFVIDGGRLLL